MVVGATGQTGRRVLQQMLLSQECHAIGGVRNEWGAKRLSQECTVFRGFQRTTVPAVTAPCLEIRQTDVITMTDEDLRQALLGVDTLVITTGMVASPRTLGNPFLLHRQARAVDCVGTQRLIDAAKQAGTVRKVVLLSSILTNARHWNQTSAPGFFITNLLGNVLDRKLEAEQYLRASGLEYTIVRAAELTSPQPQAESSTAEVVVCAEDTLNGGTISRDLVASVCVECALSDKNHKYSNQVIEIHQRMKNE